MQRHLEFYFWDGFVRDYKKQPEYIKEISRDKILSVAREFIRDGVYCLGAVSSNQEELVEDISNTLKNVFCK